MLWRIPNHRRNPPCRETCTSFQQTRRKKSGSVFRVFNSAAAANSKRQNQLLKSPPRDTSKKKRSTHRERWEEVFCCVRERYVAAATRARGFWRPSAARAGKQRTAVVRAAEEGQPQRAGCAGERARQAAASSSSRLVSLTRILRHQCRPLAVTGWCQRLDSLMNPLPSPRPQSHPSDWAVSGDGADQRTRGFYTHGILRDVYGNARGRSCSWFLKQSTGDQVKSLTVIWRNQEN